MIIRARIVVPMEDEPIENGAVAVERNQIREVGRFDDLKINHGGEVFDLGEQIVLPGLINAHCHLDYAILRGQIAPQRSFTDWVRAINARKAALSPDDFLASIAAGFAEARKFGTTTLVNLEAFPELLPRMPRPPLRTWWCAEMIDVRKQTPVREIAKNLDEWFSTHTDWMGGFGLAPHAPYTASRQLYSAAAEISRDYNAPLTTHLAESSEEMQMFRDADGPLFDFLKGIGRDMSDCGRETPVARFIEVLCDSSTPLRSARNDKGGSRPLNKKSEWLVAHLNELTEGDLELLARAPKFHIAHCPRSHSFFRHAPFALKKLRALGFNICLGTDSLASNPSLSLFSEMRELLRKEPSMSSREVVEMATVNAAHAIGRADSLGRIGAGAQADLIAIPFSSSVNDLFDAIVAFDPAVPWMMVDGETVAP